MFERGCIGLAWISVTRRISVDASVSYKRPGDDQKDPFPFQQRTMILAPWCLSVWPHHLELHVRGVHTGGKESQINARRFLITSHFPAFLAAATCSLDCFSSATCAQVRSSSRNILSRSENSLRLALRAQSLSAALWNLRKRVESRPTRALSKVKSGRPRVSLRSRVPTSIGSAEGSG